MVLSAADMERQQEGSTAVRMKDDDENMLLETELSELPQTTKREQLSDADIAESKKRCTALTVHLQSDRPTIGGHCVTTSTECTSNPDTIEAVAVTATSSFPAYAHACSRTRRELLLYHYFFWRSNFYPGSANHDGNTTLYDYRSLLCLEKGEPLRKEVVRHLRRLRGRMPSAEQILEKQETTVPRGAAEGTRTASERNEEQRRDENSGKGDLEETMAEQSEVKEYRGGTPQVYRKRIANSMKGQQAADGSEVSYVADMATKYSAAAAERKLKLIFFCGAGSLPSDLTVLMTQREALRMRGIPCHKIRTAVTDCFGGFSGGSVMGLGRIFEEGAVFDPFFLVKYASPNPPSEEELLPYTRPQIFLAKHDEDFGYCAYNFLAPLNENVVRFSSVLLGLYEQPGLQLDLPSPAQKASGATDKGRVRAASVKGSSSALWRNPSFFRYSECVALGYDMLTASVVSLVTFVLMFLVTSSICRAALTALHIFPRPGEGPPRQFLDKGHFQIKTVGRVYPTDENRTAVCCVPTDDEEEAENARERRYYGPPHCHDRETVITVTMGSASGDPGYKETGKMLVETGLAIALHVDDCFDLCGVCTPASGVGLVLVDRLRKAGMKFEVKVKQF
ncbi:uncharacterized protein LOC131479416 [Ochotona princeps]|uniref:uncharacterized protein LOC131479416 n=1 Tax=Ochotona princeps TaxID=9978 RepID=UPI002714A270|nr:uncharacterized protein LOC131479416 [Ochotona princeps]